MNIWTTFSLAKWFILLLLLAADRFSIFNDAQILQFSVNYLTLKSLIKMCDILWWRRGYNTRVSIVTYCHMLLTNTKGIFISNLDLHGYSNTFLFRFVIGRIWNIDLSFIDSLFFIRIIISPLFTKEMRHQLFICLFFVIKFN